MKVIHKKMVKFLSLFLIGGFATGLVSNSFFTASELNAKEFISKEGNLDQREQSKQGALDPFEQMEQIHALMKKRMEEAFGKSMLSDSFFDNSAFEVDVFDSSSTGSLRVENREDGKFKYVDIFLDNLDKNSININISKGMVSVSAETRRQDDVQNENSRSMTNSVSRISRSFSVPQGVKGDQAKIDSENDKIVIKFPKDLI